MNVGISKGKVFCLRAKSMHDNGVEILKLLVSIIVTKKKNIGLL